MKKANRWILPLLLVGALAHAQGKPKEAEQTVEAVGEAAILDGNEVKAKEDAKLAAFRSAVEQVAGTLVSADTLVRSSELVHDRIYTQAQGYVKRSGPPAYQKNGNVMVCTVSVTVSKEGLDRDLQAVQRLVKSLEGRRLVILLQEQTLHPGGAVTNSNHVSPVLTTSFKEDGWDLIDPMFAAGKVQLQAGAGASVGQLKELADLTQAHYILYGTVLFRNQEPFSGGMIPMKNEKGEQMVFPVTGEYDLTVFSTTSGAPLAKVSGRLVYGRPGESAAALARKMTVSYERSAFDIVQRKKGEIIGGVRAAVVKELAATQDGGRIVMDVAGLSDMQAVDRFSRALGEKVKGVREVRTARFGQGKANFDVVFAGSPSELARGMSGWNFMGRKVTVTGMSGNQVEVSVGK